MCVKSDVMVYVILCVHSDIFHENSIETVLANPVNEIVK